MAYGVMSGSGPRANAYPPAPQSGEIPVEGNTGNAQLPAPTGRPMQTQQRTGIAPPAQVKQSSGAPRDPTGNRGGAGGAPPPNPPPPPPGGGRTATSLRGVIEGRSEDYERFNDEVLNDWLQKYGDSSCPDTAPFKSARGESGCWEKPTECPPGPDGNPLVPQGPNETDPCGPPRVYNGGASRTGGATSGDGAPGGWGLSEEEKNYLTAVTNLANTTSRQSQQLFGQAMPAYTSSLEHWKKVSGAYGKGGMDAALGPARETIADSYRGAAAQTRGLRGAERAQATSNLAQGEAGDLGRLGAEQQGAAYAGLESGAQFGISTGLAGEGQAAGLYAGAQQAESQTRLTEEGYGVQKDIADLNAKTQWNIASLQANVSRESIAAQKYIAEQSLALNSKQFEQQFEFQNKQFIEQQRQFNLNLQFQNQQSGDSKTSSIIGGAVAVAGTVAMLI